MEQPNYAYLVFINPALGGKKYEVRFAHRGKWRRVSFGQKGASDFILSNGNEKKKQDYIARHKVNEDWTIRGIGSAGFWARWVLWNKPTFEMSIKDIERRFPIIMVPTDFPPVR